MKIRIALLILCMTAVIGGCGIVNINNNTTFIDSVSIGADEVTVRKGLVPQNPVCAQFGIIEKQPIVGCKYQLSNNMRSMYDDYIYFHKSRYVGKGNSGEFLSSYPINKDNNAETTKAVIRLVRILDGNVKTDYEWLSLTGFPRGFNQSVEVYSNNEYVGSLIHDGSIAFDREVGDVNISLQRNKKIFAELKLNVGANDDLKIYYDYKTGETYLEGDEKSTINITSSPTGAAVYSGKTRDSLVYTGRLTPSIFNKSRRSLWASEYYQVKLDGYESPDTVFKDNSFGNRNIHFALTQSKPIEIQKPTKPSPPAQEHPPKVTVPDDYNIYTGTGWLTKGGYVVTNHHVIDGEVETLVRFSGIDSQVYSAKVVISDKHNDLAILRLDDREKIKVKGIKIATGLPKIGESVFTIGYPKTNVMGKNPKLTNGIVSSLSGLQDDPRIIQTTVAIQSGNSGGPLLNMRGEAVGVTTSILRPRMKGNELDIPQDVNYAVKSAYVHALLSSLPDNESYPMLTVPSSKLEDIVPAVQDSIVQVIVKSNK